MQLPFQLPFRYYHALRIIKSYASFNTPLDLHVRRYFLSHRALGSKDRKKIADHLYNLVRFLNLVDHFSISPSWENRLWIAMHLNPLDYLHMPHIPLHKRVGFPKPLFDRLTKQFGEAKAVSLCLALNTKAPTTIRINPLKTTKQTLMQQFGPSIAKPTKHSPLGLTFSTARQLTKTAAFKNGLFEMQDESCQLGALLIQPKPKQHILDFCAGSGGKSLAFAHQVQKPGMIYLHDSRPQILRSAKARFIRAGVERFQIVENINHLPCQMDIIVLDVPCSGSGAFRRNISAKWECSPHSIANRVREQRDIFQAAFAHLKVGGKMFYMTCSLFEEENQEQVQFFIKKYSMRLAQPYFISLPEKGEMDGFFAAVMVK